MWKDYSAGFIKKNRASSLSIMVAAFIASLFLSFLCHMFYNFWVYEVETIILEEGDWQGRITGTLSDEDILAIGNFANVERVVKNDALSGGGTAVVDLYFQNPRTIFEDLPLITERLGLSEEAGAYNRLLLSEYLIHDPQDETPPLLLTFYLAVLMVVSLSLILIIHNSFAVSMNARVHQFGIFSSIGAAPGQIRTCLMQESAVLCAVPILLGNLQGILLGYGAKQGVEMIGAGMPGRHEISFRFHPAVFAATILITAATVLFSAWLPARKLSRLTPLEAIRNANPPGLRRKRNSRILGLLFGIEGELAGNALKAQKKALRTSTLSLTLSFLGFTTMLCLFSLTDLSTKYTYTERYQDTWDIMVSVKDAKIEDFPETESLREAEGVRDFVVYQKAEMYLSIPEDAISPELAALGGPEAVAGAAVSRGEGMWRVKAPVVVMDDVSFAAYCEQNGITPQLTGTVVLNRIWDSLNSVFRYREYVPFIREDFAALGLSRAGHEAGAAEGAEDEAADGSDDGAKEIPVLGYAAEGPLLKEEYEDYALVQFMPLSLWKTAGGMAETVDGDINIRILALDGASLAELDEMERRITDQLERSYTVESENRVEDRIMNERIIDAYKLVIGSLCGLLAMIGIANVFSYTAGFLRQRRREFAQYMSVGMTPAGMRKLFYVEAFVIAGRPIAVTLPLTVLFVEFMARASYLNPKEVWPEIPVAAISLFSLAVIGFVALAYYIGGKRVLKYSLADALRDDTMG